MASKNTTSKSAAHVVRKERVTDPAGRTDLWKPKFSQLVIVPKLNVRTDYGDLEDLSSIATVGVKQPLRGWREDGKYYVTDGHRRYEKLAELFKKDKIDREVLFILEPKGYTDQQRVLDMFRLNTGKQLTPLEQAEGIFRLKEKFGMSEADIARELGKSAAYINRLSEFSKASPELKEAVANNTISATTAVNLLVANQEEQFLKDLDAGVYEPPKGNELFQGDSTGAPIRRAGSGKTARIKESEIKKKNQQGGAEVKDPPINSWGILKGFVKNYEGKPSDPAAAKFFLFIGKVISNTATEADMKRTFKQ